MRVREYVLNVNVVVMFVKKFIENVDSNFGCGV